MNIDEIKTVYEAAGREVIECHTITGHFLGYKTTSPDGVKTRQYRSLKAITREAKHLKKQQQKETTDEK